MIFTGDPHKAIEKVEQLVADLPETTCAHRGICCRAGCPNMTLGEYLWISRDYVEKLDRNERLSLILTCVSLYLDKQDPRRWRPCPLLTEDMKCKAYLARPFRCRTYGLIPEELYRRMANEVEKETGIPSTFTPLCIQCKLVKMKPEFLEKYPGGKITEGKIVEIERSLRENDKELGVSEQTQKEGFSYLTFHDWHLLFCLGGAMMSHLSKIRIEGDKAAKESFMKLLKEQIVGIEKEETDGR